METILFILGGILYAEVTGYFLHRLLHSESLPWLSRNHMLHHLRLYGPDMPMRTDGYKTPPHSKWFGVGLEWIVPVILLAGTVVLVLSLFGVPLLYQAATLVAAAGWAILLFNYMHDALHRSGFWMTRTRFCSKWFYRVRYKHDIHHKQLTNSGLMNRNFGICFFWMDRLFGTFQLSLKPCNPDGLAAAKKRYASLLDGSNG